MKKFAAVALLAFPFASTAFANDQQEVENIGHCLTYAFVRAGLDGEKEVPRDLDEALSFIKNEYEARAANIGMDEQARQKAIVLALHEKNLIVQSEGMGALDAKYKTLCQNIADTFANAAEQQQSAGATDNLSRKR